MPDPQTQDGNCCRLDELLDRELGRLVSPGSVDEVAEYVQAILAQELHPRTQELVGAINSLVMAGYAERLNRRLAEEVASRDVA